MAETKLLPCPFCGGDKATMYPPTCRPETPYNPADRLFPIVRCMSCFSECTGQNEDYSGKTAIAGWNNRPQASRIAELEKALREIIIMDDTGPMRFEPMPNGPSQALGGSEGKFAAIAQFESTGGPAFPSEYGLPGGGSLTSPGMTLRDYFAAHAPTAPDDEVLKGIFDGFPVRDYSGYHNGCPHKDIRAPDEAEEKAWLRNARILWRWHYADAMLAERSKP